MPTVAHALLYILLAALVLVLIRAAWKDPKSKTAISAAAGMGSLFALLLFTDAGLWSKLPVVVRYGKVLVKFRENVERALLGYETEIFRGEDLLTRIPIEQHPENALFSHSLRFTLKYAAVPDSVIVWENDGPMAPTRFDVDGRTVRVKIAWTPEPAKRELLEYVIRYFRKPEL